MKSYTLTDLRDMADELGGEPATRSVEDFLDFLERDEEVEELLLAAEPDFEDDDQPVDLFGVSGIPGVATRQELAEMDSSFSGTGESFGDPLIDSDDDEIEPNDDGGLVS